MTRKPPMRPDLWTPRPVEETISVYRDWAQTYDDDIGARGYHTPARIAAALRMHLAEDGPILDFGCGTGLSGAALTKVGFGPLHGTDITAEMVEIAQDKGLYRRLWVSAPGEPPAKPGDYRAIAAAGVVSLGAAPPQTLDMLIGCLGKGDLLAFSFNDPTVADGSYDAQLTAAIDKNMVTVLSREHGPHLDEHNMGADVIVLRRL